MLLLKMKQIDYKTEIKGTRALEIYLAKFFIQIWCACKGRRITFSMIHPHIIIYEQIWLNEFYHLQTHVHIDKEDITPCKIPNENLMR